MKTHTSTSRYKLLVLLDKSKSSHQTLKDAVSFAKKVDASIDVFQVEPPTSVVKYENQMASMRAINEERYKQEKQLKEIVTTIKNEESLPVISNFTFGNVKNEIVKHIEKTQPDVVVLGKRNKKAGGIIGDRLTKEIVNSYAGNILISGNEKGLMSLENQSIGFLNTIEGVEKVALVNDIEKYAKKPHKVFKTIPDENPAPMKTNEHNAKDKPIVFEFNAKNSNASSVANFISKNNLALLCVRKNFSFRGEINKIIEKTNVPVLVLNNTIN